ncbi:MAG TPA: LPS assembly protein LptD [Stellaceae bacterium]|nr:LPS assembly protein LptD [Stellaceae bacterium]
MRLRRGPAGDGRGPMIRPRLVLGMLAAALVALAAFAAAAQTGLSTVHKQNRNAPIALRADEVEYDEDLALTIARGHVEISQNGEVLLADTVTYNQRTDTITASGHVSLSQPTGEILFANYLELRDAMSQGFAKDVRMLLADRSRLAANTARRTNGNRIELRRAVYSPCDLCRSDPSAPPEWQIEAREINDDQRLKLIEFRDATMQIDGWPVFYTPYISVPDPSVKRASGFLAPSFGNSNTIGAHITIPYFLVLGPDKDITFEPRFTTKAGPVAGAEYRERFDNGELEADGSLNYSNPEGTEDTGNIVRGMIDEHSVFDLNDTWRTGLDVQRVSDQSYLLEFGYGNPLLNAEISRAYLEGFDPRGATDVDAYMFQPLLPGLGDSTQPIVLPVINRDWQSEPDALGGRWNLNANLLDIVREVGTQTRRLSLGSEWQRSFEDGIGGKYLFTASLRGDAYSVNNLSPVSNPDLPSAYFPIDGKPAAEPIATNFLTGRAFPQVGLKWSYPLIHPGSSLTPLIEPIVAVYAGPNGGNQRKIPDEDSLSFNYDDTDLFRPDRLAGYDILDTGQRVDYGTKFGLYDNSGGSYRVLVGQSYRAETNPFLPPGSGAENRLSDVVGRVVLAPSSYLDLIYRFRLAANDLAYREQQAGITTGPQNLRVSANYVLIPAQVASDVVTNPVTGQNVLYGKQEQLSLSVTTKLTRYWSLQGSETINLTGSSNIVNGIATPESSSNSLYATVAAIYQDECMAFIGSLTQSGIRNGAVSPGVSVQFSVVFKNIGEIGGTVASIAGGSLP